jgi:hypothetical protein
MKTVKKIANKIEAMCAESERDLLLLTIQIGNGPVELCKHSQFDLYMPSGVDNLEEDLNYAERACE